jgi:chloramphenicol-sensitive protein RarD
MTMQVEKEKRSEHSIGLINGFIAYIIWGAVILYWPYLAPAQPLEILAHRILWSLLFVAVILIYQKRIVSLRVVLKNSRQMKLLAMASLLIGFNWGLFIWASMNGHVLDSSLGYYITPLLNVALGVFFFKEKLRKMQWIAIGIAAFAVLFITIAMGVLPWVALSLSTSFAMYGYVKKLANVEALESLMIETLILTPIAIGYLIWLQFNGGNTFLAYGLDHTLWMASAGIVTAIPLLAFGVAIVRLPLTTLGMLQYIGPTIQFFVGIWLTQEAMPQLRFIGFAITWVALVILTIDALRNRRNVNKSLVAEPD